MNIVIAMIIVMFRPVLFAIHATGKVKYMSLLAGITYTAILPATYFYFKHGYSANTPYVLSVIAFLICSFGNMFILKNIYPLFPSRVLSGRRLGDVSLLLFCLCCFLSICISAFPMVSDVS